MRSRVLSAVVLAPLAIAAVLGLPTHLLAALLALILLLALWEWAGLVGVGTPLGRGQIVAGNAAAMAALAWFGWPQLAPAVVLAGVLWWLLAGAWLWRRREAVASRHRGIAAKLLAGSLSTIPAWAALALLHADGEHGSRWALFALVLVWGVDIGAFLVGSRFGRRPLAPRISPNKTWEGFWGGLATTQLLAPAALPALGLAWTHLPALLVLAAVAALFAVLGDLVESLIKRQAGSKDSGHVIPGHGGMLDRIDGLLAALPAFALAKLGLGL